MWILFAFLSAFFAGITAILAKCGIKKTDSNIATAIRTIVVLIFAWAVVFIVGSQETILRIDAKSLVFLILSGIATGVSWLCYFKALQTGDINKVTPVDKSSTVLTIILALIFFHEEITLIKGIAMIMILAGTFLMIQKKETHGERTAVKQSNSWLLYALLSAVFASLTSILAKAGIENVESNLGTAIRTSVVLVISWILVFAQKKSKDIKNIPKKELLFICLSGIATGASWLCYYKALQDGPASVVVPVDKLSIIVTVVFSYIIFKEKLTKKSLVGLLLLVAGTFAMLL